MVEVLFPNNVSCLLPRWHGPIIPIPVRSPLLTTVIARDRCSQGERKEIRRVRRLAVGRNRKHRQLLARYVSDGPSSPETVRPWILARRLCVARGWLPLEEGKVAQD
jgi:hypothetical protein